MYRLILYYLLFLLVIASSALFIHKNTFSVSLTPGAKENTKLPVITTPNSFRIPILMYHYVEYVKDPGDTIRISLNILPSVFDLQVKTLKDAGYTFMTQSEIPDLFSGKAILPAKPVILTFDDGYRGFYTDVFPILKKYQVKAVAYIVPGFLDRPNNLTYAQLHEIASSGLVEIAAHTIDHSYLKGLDAKRVRFEVMQSKVVLEQELGIPIVSFAYPYGAFDPTTVQIVKEAGFSSATAILPGDLITKDNLFFLSRTRPGARTGQDLLDLLSN